jgi:hypothetical protein
MISRLPIWLAIRHPRNHMKTNQIVRVLCVASALAGQICFASTITVDYRLQATAVVSALDVGGVTATPAASQLQLLNTGGLGVVGGTSQYTIDGIESVKFTFDSGSATGVFLDYYYIVNQNPGLYSRPQASITGFGVGGGSLGTLAILPFTSYPTTNVSALFGNAVLSGFSVSGNQTGMQISDIVYTSAVTTPEPSAGTLAGAGTALLGLWVGRRRRSLPLFC